MEAASPGGVTAGKLIGRTFAVWTKIFWRLAGASVVAQLASAGIMRLLLPQLADRGPANFSRPPPEQAAVVFSGRYWLAVTAAILVGMVQAGALTAGVLQHLAGRRMSVGGMLLAGLRRAGAILVAGMLIILAGYLGLVLLVVPGIIVALMFSLAVAVLLSEQVGPLKALGRSRALTKGHRWKLLGLYLIVYLASLGPLFLLSSLVRDVPYMGQVLTVLVSSTLGSLVMVATAVAYHDLRQAKEGAQTAELVRVFE